MSTTTEVIEVYNKMTDVNNEFNLMNYLSSLRYCQNGLLLSSALTQLGQLDSDYRIVDGFDHTNPSDRFTQVSVQVINQPIHDGTIAEMNMDHRYSLKEKEFSLQTTNNETYIIVII